jgi:hypothetical protein
MVPAQAQLLTHIITLSGDSILYTNAPFRFVELVDARTDTTKLGLLKEGKDPSTYQRLDLPAPLSDYLSDYLSNVTSYSDVAEPVAVVIREMHIQETPLGAIELAKADLQLDFYLIKDQRYRHIRQITKQHAFPDKEVSPHLGSVLETAIRMAFSEFLALPSTEGEVNQWLDKAAFGQAATPATRLQHGPNYALEFENNKFYQNGQKMKRKEALATLRATEDAEILDLLQKNRFNGYYSYVFGSLALGLAAYPVAVYLRDKDELTGALVLAGTVAAIGSLLTAKANRHYMHQAVEVYNKRYNQ